MNKMKRYLFILVAAAAMLTACQEKKESTVIIAPKPEPVKPSGPILMQDMKAENSVEWIGKTYKVIVNRKVDRELPMVEVEPGKKAYAVIKATEVMVGLGEHLTLSARNQCAQVGCQGVFRIKVEDVFHRAGHIVIR